MKTSRAAADALVVTRHAIDRFSIRIGKPWLKNWQAKVLILAAIRESMKMTNEQVVSAGKRREIGSDYYFHGESGMVFVVNKKAGTVVTCYRYAPTSSLTLSGSKQT